MPLWSTRHFGTGRVEKYYHWSLKYQRRRKGGSQPRRHIAEYQAVLSESFCLSTPLNTQHHSTVLPTCPLGGSHFLARFGKSMPQGLCQRQWGMHTGIPQRGRLYTQIGTETTLVLKAWGVVQFRAPSANNTKHNRPVRPASSTSFWVCCLLGVCCGAKVRAFCFFRTLQLRQNTLKIYYGVQSLKVYLPLNYACIF